MLHFIKTSHQLLFYFSRSVLTPYEVSSDYLLLGQARKITLKAIPREGMAPFFGQPVCPYSLKMKKGKFLNSRSLKAGRGRPKDARKMAFLGAST